MTMTLPPGRIDYLICRREADAPDGVLYAAGDFAGQRTADGGWVIVPEVTLMRAEAATYAGAHAARLLADAFNAFSPGPEGREPWVVLPAVVHLPLSYRADLCSQDFEMLSEYVQGMAAKPVSAGGCWTTRGPADAGEP